MRNLLKYKVEIQSVFNIPLNCYGNTLRKESLKLYAIFFEVGIIVINHNV